jgi:hypothetical protein
MAEAARGARKARHRRAGAALRCHEHKREPAGGHEPPCALSHGGTDPGQDPSAAKALPRCVLDVSFNLGRGTTLALVGESGSNKSTLGRATTGLVPIAGGSLCFEGEKSYYRDVAMMFQDPLSSLIPRRRVRALITVPCSAARSETPECCAGRGYARPIADTRARRPLGRSRALPRSRSRRRRSSGDPKPFESPGLPFAGIHPGPEKGAS